ncbi:hypothetical protein DDZ13_05525 [Coraliomargarita sinensis]|uniref:Uncharacterized protein n=1 Tax=Coraliomargarita sinensis TaxID=2174842 RepID=A0A317ZK72_9BACT|nr:hypothetical protein [Coraliomargarita sinensis]PXA04633.1 hypothetical protein DDZ13_05525 [Coraliomargarita sinensis]
MSKEKEPRFDEAKQNEIAAKVADRILSIWKLDSESPFHAAISGGVRIKVVRLLSKFSAYTLTDRIRKGELKGCNEAQHKAHKAIVKRALEEDEQTIGMMIADELCTFHDYSIKRGKGNMHDYYCLAAYFDVLIASDKLLEKLKNCLSGYTANRKRTKSRNAKTPVSPKTKVKGADDVSNDEDQTETAKEKPSPENKSVVPETRPADDNSEVDAKSKVDPSTPELDFDENTE